MLFKNCRFTKLTSWCRFTYQSPLSGKQGVRSGTDDKVLEVKLSLLLTGPFKILAVGPCANSPDGNLLPRQVLYLDPPSDMPGKDSKHRVSGVRCKPCATGHRGHAEIPSCWPYTQYVLNNYSTKSPPYHLTEDDVSAPVVRLDIKQITGHYSVRGRGGVMAVIYEIALAWYTPPFFGARDGARDGPPTFKMPYFAVLIWFSQPTPYQANRCYRAMRIGVAMRERAHQGDRYLPSGYSRVSRFTWDRRFAATPLPVGAFFWDKAQDRLWRIGKICGPSLLPDQYILRFLDDPGPVKITLFSSAVHDDNYFCSWILVPPSA